MNVCYEKARFPEYGFDPPSWWPLGKFMWSIFGNNDDQEPIMELYQSYPSGLFAKILDKILSLFIEDKQNRIRFHWLFIRNPLHNFDFYIIGFRDHDRIVYGKAPCTIFIDQGWNYYIAQILPYKWFWLPFVSCQKKFGNRVFQFYFGWRHGSDFGFKLRLHQKEND